ncbi:hypothetical protein MNBD_BACTEROID03-2356 [hydrothermal vent metagenome]|uniref:YbbR-like domain-containing protein n=1 Tax=hydrothermal vent metagenome TaxID=652676 RepID=A0A3B0U8H6_9ZZZZ
MFLLCSTLAWFISNLSKAYTSNTTFDLEFVNISPDQLLISATKNQIDVKLKAIGFQLFGFSFKNKRVKIDMSTVKKKSGRFYIPYKVYKKQIEKQIPSSMQLFEMDQDTLFFEFDEVISKNVPVKPRLKLNLAQNYLLDGKVTIEPSVITIKGPKNEVDTINNVKSLKIDLTDLTSNFSQKATIYKSRALKNTSFSTESVLITGKVSRFSEKIITVDVDVINLLKGLEIKVFPNKVGVLCKASMTTLKTLTSSDFSLVVDYAQIKENHTKKLSLVLKRKPKNLHSAILKEKEVAYILKRK